jgi:hypothetical protein
MTNKNKHRCKHPKIPTYTTEEQAQADALNVRINAGDTSAYSELTKLSVAVAVSEGRCYRETCGDCQEQYD